MGGEPAPRRARQSQPKPETPRCVAGRQWCGVSEHGRRPAQPAVGCSPTHGPGARVRIILNRANPPPDECWPCQRIGSPLRPQAEPAGAPTNCACGCSWHPPAAAQAAPAGARRPGKARGNALRPNPLSPCPRQPSEAIGGGYGGNGHRAHQGTPPHRATQKREMQRVCQAVWGGAWAGLLEGVVAVGGRGCV